MCVEGKLAFEETNKIRTGGELDDVPALKATELAQNNDTQTEEKEELVENKKVDGKSEAVAKKRTLTEMKGGVSEEELEAYKRSRAMTDDPMAKLLGTDQLLL